MRIALAAALVLAMATPAFAADPVPEGAQPAVTTVTGMMQNSKNARFRKLKVTAAGDVCGTVSASASSRDMEFIWTKTSGTVWLNESPQEAYSAFVYGHPLLKRSTERTDFQAWKACQKG